MQPIDSPQAIQVHELQRLRTQGVQGAIAYHCEHSSGDERRRAVGDHCGERIQDWRDLEPTMTIDPVAP